MIKDKQFKRITKKKVWSVFSKYIRLRDCLETTGCPEYGICVTCNKKYEFQELQAGHIIDGHSGENYMDERGVFAQCVGCNVFKNGNKQVYIPWFLDTFGRPLYEELLRESKIPVKWTKEKLAKKYDQIMTDLYELENGLQEYRNRQKA